MKTNEKTVSIDIMGSPMTALDAGEGEVVVLGHSFLWDAEMWRPQIELLSRHYRVIVPNLWGHGASGPLPEGTRDLLDIARHHLMLLDRLGIRRFALAGLSVGGMWGVELAGLAPDRLRGLALLDTYAGPEPSISRNHYFALLAAVEASRALPEQALNAIVPLFFSPNIHVSAPDLPIRFRAALKAWDPDRLVDSVVPLGRMIFDRRDALGDLSGLAMPTIVMTGAGDIPRPVQEGRQMASALRCRFVELPGAGHISSLEAPGAVTRELATFLSGLPR